jgi:hypothetical protein
MGIPAIIHLAGEDAILGELDSPPDPTHNFIVLRNVRKKDGKSLAYLAEGVELVLYAWHRITFLEIMVDIKIAAGAPGASAAAPAMVGATTPQQTPAGTTVLGFFRDDS